MTLKDITNQMDIHWYSWIWALSIIIICALFFCLLWLAKLIKFNSYQYPIVVFESSPFLNKVWDWVPDQQMGGEKYCGASFSIFVIMSLPMTDAQSTRLLKHEVLGHTCQVFEYGPLYPILYSIYWIFGFIKYLIITKWNFVQNLIPEHSSSSNTALADNGSDNTDSSNKGDLAVEQLLNNAKAKQDWNRLKYFITSFGKYLSTAAFKAYLDVPFEYEARLLEKDFHKKNI